MITAKEARDCTSKAGVSVILYNLILSAIAREEYYLVLTKAELEPKEQQALINLGYWIKEEDEFKVRITW